MQKKKQINIAYPICEADWKNSVVSMLSIIENNSSFINFYLLENNLEKKSLFQLNKFIDINKDLCKITVLHIETKDLNSVNLYGTSVVSSWFRILFPNLCPNVDKVIFMAGCPTLVTGDLAELYDTDISDKYILAADDVLNAQENVKKYNLLSETYSNINILLLNR